MQTKDFLAVFLEKFAFNKNFKRQLQYVDIL